MMSITAISALVCLLALPTCSGSATQEAVEPIPLGPGPHLFIDDFLIVQGTNLTRTTHQPRKLGQPIIGKAEDWHQKPNMYLKVLYDPEKPLFRMWYNVGGSMGMAFAYAESGDGVMWQRPNLGILGIGGSRANNLFKNGGYGSGLAVDDGPDCPNPARCGWMALCPSTHPTRAGSSLPSRSSSRAGSWS